MRPRRPPLALWKKLAFSAVLTVGLLGGFEVFAHWLWAEPPPFDMVARLSRCQLEQEAAGVALRCDPAQREETVMALPKPRPRVVLMGGSSVRRPTGGNLATMLQQRLQGVEVVNLAVDGMGAANIALLSSQLAAAEPDLVVIYTGHNDYNSSVYLGRVQAARLWMMPVYGLLARSWIHALLSRSPVLTQGSEANPAHRQQRFVPLATEDDTALRLRPALDARLESDLGLAVAESPAPVVLMTLARNPDHPPSGVLSAGLPGCAEAVGIDTTAGSQQRLERDLAALEAACGEGSLTWWTRSRLLRAQGKEADAAEAFARSTELDPVPLRAPVSADTLIRRVAAAEGATLVDLREALGPLPDGELFTDPLHLSRRGADTLARVLEPVVKDALGLADGATPQGGPGPAAPGG